jgi:uncharacterized protein (DUF1697 family)
MAVLLAVYRVIRRGGCNLPFMPRYAAFLRGVMPTNASMADLKRAFESAGFTDVKTVLGSGNVAFTAKTDSNAALEKKAEAAMAKALGKSFFTIVRPVEALQALLAADPFKAFRVKPGTKRVVTFLREAPKTKPKLPIEADGARIFVLRGLEAFTAYGPSDKGPVFMKLIERAFGKEQTTRTWDTVGKVAR